MMRGILRTLVVLLLLLAAMVTIFVSPWGLPITLKLTKELVPGQLTYQNAKGLLTGPITIGSIHYKNHSQDITLTHLYLRWNLWALITKEIDIHELNVDQISIKLKNSSQKSNLKSNDFKIKLPFHIRIQQAQLNYLSIKWANVNEPTVIKNVNINADLGVRAHLKIQAQQLQPYPLNIALQLTGNWQQYHFKLQASSAHGKGEINGEGNYHQLSLNSQNFQALGGQLNLNAMINWRPHYQWHATINAKKLDLQSLYPLAPKNISLQLNSVGQLSPTLQFNIQAQLQTAGNDWSIHIAHKKQWSGNWKINSENLKTLWPNLKGKLQSQGHFSGELMQPDISGSFTLHNSQYQQYRTKYLHAEWQLNLNKHFIKSLNIEGQKIQWQQHVAKKLKIKFSGNLTQQKITADVDTRYGTVNFIANSQRHDQNLKIQIEKLMMSTQKQTWNTQQTANINWTGEQLVLDPICLYSNEKGKICIQGQWDRSQPWKISLTGEKIPAAVISRFLMPELDLDSNFNINAEVTGRDKNIQTAKLQIKFSKGQIKILTDTQLWQMPLQSGDLNVELTHQGLVGQLLLQLTAQNKLQINLKLPEYHGKTIPSKNQKIEGEINFNLQNLGKYFANTSNIVIKKTGYLQAKMRIGGSIANPIIEGNAKLQGTDVSIPITNITLTDLQIHAHALNHQIKLTASANSNKELIKLNAIVQLKQGNYPITATITGKNILIANTPDYQIYVSPDLKVNLENEKITVTGNIDIPKAKLSPQKFSGSVTVPENDMVYIGQRQILQGKSNWKINANIQLKLGKSVKLDSYGLDTNLEGQLNIIANSKGYFGKGSIFLSNGTFNLLGQELTIDPNSSISFLNTPLTNPTLGIKAYKRIQAVSTGIFQQSAGNEIIVGVQVNGTIDRPAISFYSNPAIYSQVQILSYLLLGYAAGTGNSSAYGHSAAGTMTANVSSLLLSTVNALKVGTNSAQQESIINKLRSNLGLNELGIETEQTLDAGNNPIESQTAFVIGKYFSRWLYVRYSVGLDSTINQRIDILQLQLLLGKHWMLQGTVNTNFSNSTSANLNYLGNGIDLFYTTTSKD